MKTTVLQNYESTQNGFLRGERPPFRLDYLLVGPYDRELEKSQGSMIQRRLVFNNEVFELHQYPVLQSRE